MPLVNVDRYTLDQHSMAFHVVDLSTAGSSDSYEKRRRMTGLGRLARDSISSTQAVRPRSRFNGREFLKHAEYISTDLDFTTDDGQSSISTCTDRCSTLDSSLPQNGLHKIDTSDFILQSKYISGEKEMFNATDDGKVSSWTPDDEPPLFTVLDPTSLELDFDASCLAPLDDMLLHSPVDSFAGVCWSEAVSELELDPSSFVPASKESPSRPPPYASHLVEEKTHEPWGPDEPDEEKSVNHEPVPFPEKGGDLSAFLPDISDKASFIVFDPPQFSARNQNEGIGHSPVSASISKGCCRKPLPRRIVTFCSNLLT